MAKKRSSRDGRRSPGPRVDPPAESHGAKLPRSLWIPGTLAIAGFTYLPSLWGSFVFDDYHLPFSDPNAAKAGAAFWIGGVRPVLMATYWFNFLISGTETFSYHVVSVLLHAVTALLVFFLLRRLLDLTEVKLDRRLLALFGAGLFLLHPLQTESVAYISGRSEVVAGLFYVAAWLVFVNNFGSTTKLLTAIEILLLAGAAVAGKESAISLPLILFLTDLYWNTVGIKEQVRRRAKLYVLVVLGGLLASIKILHSLTTADTAGFATQGVTPVRYALTQCRVIPQYITLFLTPVGQNADWGLEFFRSLSDGEAWAYVIGMMAFVAVIVWTYRRARLFSFGLLTFLVILVPTSSIVPIKDAMAERRMYVPIIGLILASIWVVDYFRPRLQILRDVGTLRITLGLILVVATALSFERNKVWSSDTLVWMDAVNKNPSNSRAHMGLGTAYLRYGYCAGAIREYQIVDWQVGSSLEIMGNLTLAYECNHQPQLALMERQKIANSNMMKK
jgi:hypothetical protein